jgi:putative flippase GtrA
VEQVVNACGLMKPAPIHAVAVALTRAARACQHADKAVSAAATMVSLPADVRAAETGWRRSMENMMQTFDTPAPTSAVVARRPVMSEQTAGAVGLTGTGAGCLPRRRGQTGPRRCSGSTVTPMLKPARHRSGVEREGEPIASLLSTKPARASRTGPAGRSPFASFAKFVLVGGGVGLASSAAVPLTATLMPWVTANALITVVSTLLGTELHARFTFGARRRAQWHQHLQSAGSATAAYMITSAAILVLHAVQPSASMFWEQATYLSASGLAGTGRFLMLRLYVFRAQQHPVKV